MRRRLAPRGAFADPAFRRLFGASAFSYGGYQIAVLALPALALAATDATAGQIAAMFFWSHLVPLAVNPIAGSLADRRSGVATLLLADALRLGALAFLGVVGLTGRLEVHHLWIVAGVLGGGNAAFDVGTQAVIPRITAAERLADANTNIARARALADTAGPGTAGPLIQWIGPVGALAVDAASYVGSLYLVLRLRRLAVTSPSDPAGSGGPARVNGARPEAGRLGPAARFLFGQRPLVLILLSLVLLNGGGAVLGSLFVPFAVDFAGVPFSALGVAAGIGNIGLVVGAAVAGRVCRRLGYVRAGGLAGLGSIAALWSFAAAGFSPAPAVMFGVYHFLFGVFAVVFGVASHTLRQILTPDRMQGSVYGVMRTLMMVSLPVGVGLGSVLTDVVGLSTTVVGACAVSSVAVVFLLLLLAQAEPEDAAASSATDGAGEPSAS